MTNYKKWDKFDLDKELSDVDKNEEIEALQTSVNKKIFSDLMQQTSNQKEMKDKAEYTIIKVLKIFSIHILFFLNNVNETNTNQEFCR
jgi:hypothetical protein